MLVGFATFHFMAPKAAQVASGACIAVTQGRLLNARKARGPIKAMQIFPPSSSLLPNAANTPCCPARCIRSWSRQTVSSLEPTISLNARKAHHEILASAQPDCRGVEHTTLGPSAESRAPNVWPPISFWT